MHRRNGSGISLPASSSFKAFFFFYESQLTFVANAFIVFVLMVANLNLELKEKEKKNIVATFNRT